MSTCHCKWAHLHGKRSVPLLHCFITARSPAYWSVKESAQKVKVSFSLPENCLFPLLSHTKASCTSKFPTTQSHRIQWCNTNYSMQLCTILNRTPFFCSTVKITFEAKAAPWDIPWEGNIQRLEVQPVPAALKSMADRLQGHMETDHIYSHSLIFFSLFLSHAHIQSEEGHQ